MSGMRVLVVEDDYLLAEELCAGLEKEGVVVIGPFGHLAKALVWADSNRNVEAAILDISIAGELVNPLAELLTDRGVKVVFATGHDRADIPQRLATLPFYPKPVNLSQILAALNRDG